MSQPDVVVTAAITLIASIIGGAIGAFATLKAAATTLRGSAELAQRERLASQQAAEEARRKAQEEERRVALELLMRELHWNSALASEGTPAMYYSQGGTNVWLLFHRDAFLHAHRYLTTLPEHAATKVLQADILTVRYNTLAQINNQQTANGRSTPLSGYLGSLAEEAGKAQLAAVHQLGVYVARGQ